MVMLLWGRVGLGVDAGLLVGEVVGCVVGAGVGVGVDFVTVMFLVMSAYTAKLFSM